MADLRNLTTGATLSRTVEPAVTPWQRTLGFLLTTTIEPERGLWFGSCGAIHTIGMRSTIDVLFLDDHGRIVAVRNAVPPNRPIVSEKGARVVIEMGPGFLLANQINVGDRLELVISAPR